MSRLLFGKQEDVQKIQDVPLKGPNGEDLFLGYKTSGYFLGAGVYISDDGYVLGIRGVKDEYFPLPRAEVLTQLQQERSLPSPLPQYSLSLLDYAFGYSLWLTLLAVVLLSVLKRSLTRQSMP
jgi:uncharacterized protein